MPLFPFAAFLTGALLSLLLPAAALISLATWYWLFSVRMPDTSEGSGTGTSPPGTEAALSHPTETAAAAKDE